MEKISDSLPKNAQWLRLRGIFRNTHWGPALAIAIIGVAASLVVFVLARNADDARIRGILELRVEWRARDFERKLALSVGEVEALAVHTAIQKEVQPLDFVRFASLDHNPDDTMAALDWVPYVVGPERKAFTRTVRENGISNYEFLDRTSGETFVSAPERDDYLPILVENTFAGAPAPLGFDILSESGRRATALLARDQGKSMATPVVQLFTVKNSAWGYQVYWPVYAGGATPATVSERRGSLRGMVVGRFVLDKVLAAAILGTPRIIEHIDFFVDTGVPGAAPALAAAFDPTMDKFLVGKPTSPGLASEDFSFTRDFEILGRHWSLVSQFDPVTVAGLRSNGPSTILGLGLLLTLLLVIYTQRERTRRMSVERLVSARTTDLVSANTELREETNRRRHTQESLKETTDLLQATFEAAPFPIAVATADTRVIMWNKAAEITFGFTAAEFIGRRCFDLIAGDQQPEFDKLLERAFGGEILTAFSVRRRNRDGKLLDISFSSAPVRRPDGHLQAVVYVLEDVSQKLSLERQFQQAQKMEAIGNLTGGMAHDFNNLLGVIIGNLDLLDQRLPQDTETRELCSDALEAAVHGADLTRRLLAFARRQPLSPEPTDANKLVSGITALLRRTLREDIEFDLKLANDLWKVLVDPAQLQAAIINLATNARDAMPTGGRLIIETGNAHLDAVYAAQYADVREGDYIRIQMCDTGTGIPAEILPQIFEPFFTTKQVGKGSGLGLSMVYGFMKQSGGHINVYSEQGKGTCFRLYLPRQMAGVETARQSETARSTGGNERILVVEDNVKLRRVVAKQLSNLGYNVFEADNAVDAIAILGKQTVDILFTDVIMPGEMNGPDLAREARIAQPGLRVLFTSGFPERRMESSGWLAENARVLSKPYRQDELARELRDILDQPFEPMASIPGETIDQVS